MSIDPRIVLLFTQVVIESLPISSSGHLWLASLLLARGGITLGSLPAFFDHFLNGPTLVVLAVYFYKAWSAALRVVVAVVLGLWTAGGRVARLSDSHRRALGVVLKLMGMAIVTNVPMLCLWCVGLLRSEANQSLSLLAMGFGITMVLLLSERWVCTARAPLTIPKALLLGFIQTGMYLLLPGVSRFALTFVAARWLGASARRALQFSFFMFFPTACGAFLLSGLPDMLASTQVAAFFTVPWLVAYAVSTMCAYGLFALVSRLALTNRFWWFACYMPVPVAVALLLWIR